MASEKAKTNLWQVVKFTLFSMSAGLIEIGSYSLFYEVFHWAPWLAHLVSLILSVIWNFTFNRKFTFRSDAKVGRCMLLVAAYYLVFTPLSTWWTAALTGVNPFTEVASSEPLMNNYVVLIGTMFVNLVTEYLFQRFVVYGDSVDSKAQQKEEDTALPDPEEVK